MKVRIGNYRGPRAKRPRIEKVVIHPWDTYSAEHTLALVIHPMLIAFRKDVEEKGGVPSTFLEPIDVSELSEEEAQKVHDEAHNEATAKWLAAIDEMIWAFEQVKDNYDGEQKFFKEKAPLEEIEDDGAILDNLEVDTEGLNAYYEKIDAGLATFAKHYRSLWW